MSETELIVPARNMRRKYVGDCSKCGHKVELWLSPRYKYPRVNQQKKCEHDWQLKGSGWRVCTKCNRVKK